ncbi:Hypothetical protein A7982_09167 [Minicystis rosea]|nr:Hypothetical protein A7982_09167 [Minicystis rosea]
MARITIPRVAAAALLVMGLAACNRRMTCRSEVTQGGGIFRGTITGSRSEAELRREATRLACKELCSGSAPSEGCTARCAVDAEAGKIGVRTTCAKESSSR